MSVIVSVNEIREPEMNRYFRILLCFLLVSWSLSASAVNRIFSLSLDDWARPRAGNVIVEFQELRDLVVLWGARETASYIEIRYPGGDEGSLWGRELGDWLVALGVPSADIRLVSGHARDDQITLLIVNRE